MPFVPKMFHKYLSPKQGQSECNKINTFFSSAGQYCPNSPTIIEIECDAGFYCPMNVTQGNNINCDNGLTNNGEVCATICPLGAYCPRGSFAPKPCTEGTIV